MRTDDDLIEPLLVLKDVALIHSGAVQSQN